MAWLKSHSELERHPKLLRFKRLMRWNKNEAVGFLHRFWWTVLEYAPSGVIPALSAEVMSESLDIEADVFDRAIIALADAGLLDRIDGGYVVHDWLDYAGQYLKESKFKRSPEKYEAAVTAHGIPPDCPGTVRGQFAQEKKRTDKKLPPTPRKRGAREEARDAELQRIREEFGYVTRTGNSGGGVDPNDVSDHEAGAAGRT